MHRRLSVAFLVAAFVVNFAQASDERFLGSWRTTTYTIAGVEHPMEGIMIFTPSYYAANVILNLTGEGADDANANSGPYWAEDGRVVFAQWMQLHWRPGDSEENFLRRGVDEISNYRFEGPDRMIIQFPSGNYYTLDRYPDGEPVSGLDGLWSYRTLQSAGGSPVELGGLFLLHQGYFLQQSINRGRPEEQLGQGHLGTFRAASDGLELTAQTGIIADPSSRQPVSSRNNSEHKIKAERKGETLTLTFGTGTVQTFDRIGLAGATDIYWLQGGALGLIDKHFILVVDSGDRQWSGSGTFSRDGDRLTLQAERWFEVVDGSLKYRSGSQIQASIAADGILVEGQKIAFRD